MLPRIATPCLKLFSTHKIGLPRGRIQRAAAAGEVAACSVKYYLARRGVDLDATSLPQRALRDSAAEDAWSAVDLFLFDDSRAAGAAYGTFVADLGLLDAIFSLYAARESHRTDLRDNFRVRRACRGNRAVTARSLHDVVLISQCWCGVSNDYRASEKKGYFHCCLSIKVLPTRGERDARGRALPRTALDCCSSFDPIGSLCNSPDRFGVPDFFQRRRAPNGLRSCTRYALRPRGLTFLVRFVEVVCGPLQADIVASYLGVEANLRTKLG